MVDFAGFGYSICRLMIFVGLSRRCCGWIWSF